ncbi:unnamed protein product [Effrenium voratum]|nr:unnamed protein product [Effrenium voratum]CAJ1447636.1 unnamed protein product [Effrenium voratum]
MLLFGQWQWQWKLWPTMFVGTWLVSGPAAHWTKLRRVSLLGQSPCSGSQMVLDMWHALDGSDDAALNPVLQPSLFACDKAWEPLLAAPWEPVALSPESQSAFRGVRRALSKAEASVQSFRADVAPCSSFDRSCSEDCAKHVGKQRPPSQRSLWRAEPTWTVVAASTTPAPVLCGLPGKRHFSIRCAQAAQGLLVRRPKVPSFARSMSQGSQGLLVLLNSCRSASEVCA